MAMLWQCHGNEMVMPRNAMAMPWHRLDIFIALCAKYMERNKLEVTRELPMTFHVTLLLKRPLGLAESLAIGMVALLPHDEFKGFLSKREQKSQSRGLD